MTDLDQLIQDVVPVTGVTREYWLTVDEVDCAPDGYPTTCQAFNGTIPGPTIIVCEDIASAFFYFRDCQ